MVSIRPMVSCGAKQDVELQHSVPEGNPINFSFASWHVICKVEMESIKHAFWQSKSFIMYFWKGEY